MAIAAQSSAGTDVLGTCPPERGVAVQVLGSGGPIADDARASSAYLIWIDGDSQILIDAGGGAFLRFGEAAAKFEELRFIGLSHFHTDHSADLPALLKSGYFSNSKQGFTIAGPGAGGPFPGLNTYLDSLLSHDHGAYRYLAGYLDGSDNLAKISPVEIDPRQTEAVTVYEDVDRKILVDALPVPHGIVPSLAYRIRIDKQVVVFGSDQNGGNPRFTDFAKHASILLMHMPVSEGAEGAARKLQAPPGVIGQIASDANAATLIISHLMKRSLDNLGSNIRTLKTKFAGRIIVADDLDCAVLTTQGK